MCIAVYYTARETRVLLTRHGNHHGNVVPDAVRQTWWRQIRHVTCHVIQTEQGRYSGYTEGSAGTSTLQIPVEIVGLVRDGNC